MNIRMNSYIIRGMGTGGPPPPTTTSTFMLKTPDGHPKKIFGAIMGPPPPLLKSWLSP